MRGTTGTFLFAMAMLLSSLSHSQTSTNDAVTNPAAGSLQTTNDAPTIPLVEMNHVPISFAIANLARQARINYIIDRRVMQTWINSKEPSVTFKLQNVTAREVLQRILDIHHLALVENSATAVTRITSNDKADINEDTNLLAALLTNRPAADATPSIPLIQFTEVPLDIALENLTRQSGFHFDYSVQLRNPDGSPWFDSMPAVSLHWENITAIQAMFALCENYDLSITKDAATGALQIEPKGFKVPHHLQLH